MRSKIIVSSLIIISYLISAGCWDRREIEELGIVAGVAIDHPQNAVPVEKNADIKKNDNRQGCIIMTHQFLVPKVLGGNEKSGNLQKKAYINVSCQGNSIYQILRDFYNVSSRRPNYEHLKVLIISEEAASLFNLYKLLNAFLRHPEIPRNVSVVISKGMASSMLEIKPKLEDVPAFELNLLARIEKGTSKKPYVLTIGNMSGKMAEGTSFAVQRVASIGGSVQVMGTAIIRGGEYRLAGWLDANETEGLNWLVGNMEGGAVETEDKWTGETIVCNIDRVRNKIKPVLKNQNLLFKVEIESDGSIAEDWLMDSDALNQAFVEKVEREVEKEVKGKIYKAIDKIQKEYKADVAGFGKQLKIKYPELWEQVKDKWDEMFGYVPIEVTVEFRVRSFGRKLSK